MENKEEIALKIMEDLKFVIYSPLFYTEYVENGAMIRELTEFGNKIQSVILKHLNQENEGNTIK